MAHYDCTNCGESMGICWGLCKRCTPKEYLDAAAEFRMIRAKAEQEWDDIHSSQKKAFIDHHVSSILATMTRLEELHRPSNNVPIGKTTKSRMVS